LDGRSDSKSNARGKLFKKLNQSDRSTV
jgi:hypothetical protein